MSKCLWLAPLLLLMACQSRGVEVMENKHLAVEIVRPDSDSPHKGPRFEWCGMVRQVTLDGKHTFCRAVDKNVDKINDGCGLAEECAEPLGFDEAAEGGEFVKIGVGIMKKPNNAPYGFWIDYPVAQAPEFHRDVKGESVTCTQIVRGPRGWAYRYSKTVALVGDEPVLTMAHRLENIGEKPIKTTQYNHNFMIFDGKPVGPSYSMRLKFRPTPETGTDVRGILQFTDDGLTYAKGFDGKPVFASIKGFGGDVAQNRIVVENAETGTGVEIAGDFPLAKLHFFTTPAMICPEPFISLSLEPGQKQEWTRTYTFFAHPAVEGRRAR